MVDEANVVSSDSVATQEKSVASDSTPVNTAVEQTQTESPSTVASAEKRPEKVFTRDEVAKITNAETKKAVEKAKREFETAQMLKTHVSPYSQTSSQATPTFPLADQGSNISPEQLRGFVQQEIARESQVKAQEMFYGQAIDSFESKLSDAQQRYPDYQEAVKNLELGSMPEENLKPFIALLDSAGTGPDVLYDIGKNPQKFSTLLNLIAINPKLAIQEVHRLSSSIKENQKAATTPVPNAPLSQITPSTTGTDNGTMTLRDMKKQPWARG